MNTPSRTIRQATIDDLDSLVTLFEGYRLFYGQPESRQEAKEFLKGRIERNESIVYISENNDGRLAGFTQLYPLFSSTRMKRVWLLNDLFVSPEFRGKGISVQLIERAKQLVRDTNASGLFLETQITNDIGNQLYPRAGLKLVTEANYYEWHNDTK